MDRERCLKILEGYGAGPNMLGLIERYWEEAELVCRSEGNFGRPFKAGRGVTQSVPLSAKIFNILVDAVVRKMLRRLYGDDAARYGVGTLEELVRAFLVLFYVDDGYIAGRDPEVLQQALNLLIPLFD